MLQEVHHIKNRDDPVGQRILTGVIHGAPCSLGNVQDEILNILRNKKEIFLQPVGWPYAETPVTREALINGSDNPSVMGSCGKQSGEAANRIALSFNFDLPPLLAGDDPKDSDKCNGGSHSPTPFRAMNQEGDGNGQQNDDHGPTNNSQFLRRRERFHHA